MAKERKNYSDPLLRKDSRGVFNLYRNRNDIGGELIDSFMSFELNRDSKGFVLNQNNGAVGLISQCYGLLTLMEYVKFDIEIEKYQEACEKINLVFNDILERVYVSADEPLVFDATPYVTVANINKYVESASLFLRVLVEIRNILCKDYNKSRNIIEISDKFIEYSDDMDLEQHTNAEIKFVEKIMTKTIDFLNESALLVNGEEGFDYYLNGSELPIFDADGTNVKYKGWTFTQIDEDKHTKTEMSLIHTYFVSDAYLSFFEFFPKSIGLVRQLRGEIYKKLADEGRVSHDGYVDVSIDELAEMLVNADLAEYGLAIDEDDVQFKRDFEYIRSIYPTFHLFNKTIVDAGRYVDTQFRNIDTTKNFFNYNFKRVTAEDVENSSSNDAMFNVLLAINIMMAAGIDIDYKDNDLAEEYYDKLQYSIPNIQRFYKKLIRDGKGDMFDKYVLKLSSALPNDNQEIEDSVFNQAKALRKQHIIMISLSPLIIKTHCIVSKYLIPYPQYEMRAYKNEIIQKKMPDTWLWDNEEYNLIDNYNYVYALRAFYDYYEVYERPYSLDKAKYIEEKEAEIAKLNETIKEQKVSFKEKLSQEQQKKEQIIEEYENSLAAERIRYDEKKTPLEQEIQNIVNSGIESAVTDMLRKTLIGIIEENGRRAGEEDSIALLFKRTMTSYLGGAYDVAMEIFDNPDDINEDIAQDVVEEAISDLIQDRIRLNKT